MSKRIILNGSSLRIDDIGLIIKNRELRIGISPKALVAVSRTERFVKKEAGGKIIYGVNTGFGPMSSHIIGKSQLADLQRNLVVSHAVGMGDPIPEQFVLAAMVVRLNTLLRGLSGTSKDLVKRLERFINLRIAPVVPEHGAVGASGDLVQLAHIALAVIGEGEAYYGGRKYAMRDLMRKLRIPPYILKPKEGLSLINGTSAMSGIAAILAIQSEKLVSVAVRLGALALELVHGFDDAISKELHDARPHHGQVVIARSLRNIVSSSRLLQKRKYFQTKFHLEEHVHEIPERVQEVYSLRCIPQILGPVLDTLMQTSAVVETEINAVTDNPIIDTKRWLFLHGGNFHGDYIAASLDSLKAGIARLTMLSERRSNFFLNRAINKHFPPFMNLGTPGLTLGLQGLQFVATSTTAQTQTLAFPHHIHSIPTNGDNQDIVSMGTDVALIVAKVIENAFFVLAVEALVLAQGVDFSKEKTKLSAASREFFEGIRKTVPTIREDRVLTGALPKLVEYIKQSPPLEFGR